MELPGRSSSRHTNTSERNAGFLMEALLLLAFLIVALAIFAQLFAHASRMGERSRELNRAVLMATSAAEQFSADPTSAPDGIEGDGLSLSCAVSPEPAENGTLYRATIRVTNESGEEVYSLVSAKYQGGDAS